jgi:NitT/TauT family transport system substrate-binding protein
MKKFRRRPGAAFVLALASLTLACGAPAQAAERLRIAIGVDSAYVSFYVAKQNKLFQKHGLDVELIEFAQGGEALDSLVAGQTPMAGAAEPTTLIRASRSDVKVLAIYGQSGAYLKFVARQGVGDPKEVKKIGIVPGSVSEFSSEMMLTKYAINPKSIEWVRAGPPEFPALLARGDVDGYFLWEPWPANGVKQGGKILLTSGDVGYTYNMWLSASGPWLAAHQPEAKA